MKNSVTKKLSCILLALVCSLTCVVLPSVDASAAVKKPAKVSFTSLRRQSKSVVRLSWRKASRAKGYQIYMKTNRGKFKRVKTTKSRSFRKTGLKIGSSYCFKIRAYTRSRGKVKYGPFSITRKIKMNNYIYLVDYINPYAWGYYNYCYKVHKGADSFMMGGNRYYKGFELDADNKYNCYAIFNLNGRYSKISFVLGQIEHNGDKNINIFCDDDLTKVINCREHSLPKSYTVNIRNTYKFEISFYNEGWNGNIGLGNVRLYY